MCWGGLGNVGIMLLSDFIFSKLYFVLLNCILYSVSLVCLPTEDLQMDFS